MSAPHIFDKAKYHSESVEEFGLPESHAYHHTAYFIRWLVDNDLMSNFFIEESSADLIDLRKGKISAIDLYESWDGCLVDDMISDVGNAFAKYYFDFAKGAYIEDYMKTLQNNLPSEYHIPFTDKNYNKLRSIIDSRFAAWKKQALGPARKFWK